MNAPVEPLAEGGERRISNRRAFLKAASLGFGSVALPFATSLGTEPGVVPNSAGGKPLMRLGLVTYNLAQAWDIATIIKNCEAARFEGVELRTTHAHGVEPVLSKDQRREVKRRFQESKVQLMGLGSVGEYHSPDQAQVRKQIETTKEFIVLAQDVGASGVKVRPNGLPKEVPVEKTLEQIGRSLREVGEFASGHGQQIRLEVHGGGTSLLPHIKTILDVASHPNVGACWNSNQTDLDGSGLDANFDLVKDRIFSVHMRDLYLDDYPWARLFNRLNGIGFKGFCLAEIPESKDPLRVMHYYRALWLALQGAG